MSVPVEILGNLSSYIKRGVTPKYVDEEGFCVLNQKCIRDGAVNYEPSRLTSKNKRFNEDKVLQDGDVLVNSTGTGTLGRTALFSSVSQSDIVLVDSHITIVRPNKKLVNPHYLAYALRLKEPNIVNMARGATNQVELSAMDLGQLELPLFSRDDQDRIAHVLQNYDELISNNKRRIELLEESARQLYKEWFVRLRFPGHEHVKIIDGVPEGWDKCQVGDLLTLQRGFDLPVKNRVEGTVPIYASTGINGYHNVHKVKAPGIVTGRSGSLGTVLYVSKDFWPLNTALWVKEFKKVTPYYALFFLRSLRLENYNGGAAVPTLNRNDVHRIETFSPPEKLIGSFNDYLNPVFKQIDTLVEQSNKLTQARDLLLPKLMSGEIAV